MTELDVLAVMKEAISTVLVVASPMLLVGMIVGVIISIFQATTQINEQTLAFVPKIVSIFLALLIFGGWMIQYLTEFVTRVYAMVGSIS